MREIKLSDKEEINHICKNLKDCIDNLIKLKINLPSKLISVYGEFLVIKKLLENRKEVKYNGAQADIDLELIQNNIKIEVKTSTIKNKMFHNGYAKKQKGKFDYIILVGINSEETNSKERFFIFSKKEANKLEKHVHWGKLVYMIYIFLRNKNKEGFKDYTYYINNNLNLFENNWKKIR